MKEYLEALETIRQHLTFVNHDNEIINDYEEECNIIEKALQRLEAIDNAKPSEALDITNSYLKVFEEEKTDVLYDIESFKQDFISVKQALLKAQDQEKVLKIMFTKTVSIFQMSCCKNADEYNDLKFNDNEKLTKDEFDLLKRWLG